MKPANPLKHFGIAFLVALILYIVAYSGCEHLRTRHGPWLVTFTNVSGTPALVIDQPQLNIARVTVSFPGQSASFTNQTIRFDPPQEVPFALPFGQCVYEDTTFQPGTLVFATFGHEVQMFPRALMLDRHEHPWQNGTTIAVTNSSKPSAQ